MGHEAAFKTITGPIFEFGAPDAILQMWAAFIHELVEGRPLKTFAACATPEETALSHRLFTAALDSHRSRSVVARVVATMARGTGGIPFLSQDGA